MRGVATEMNLKGSLLLLIVAAGCAGPQPVRRQIVSHETSRHLTPMTHQYAVPVLMYHRIANLTPTEQRKRLLRDLTVSPGDFEEQVKFLNQSGYTFLHVSEVESALREGKPLPERAIAITMDDGYRDNFTEALPILTKYGAKATIFMVTNNFEAKERLSWADARQMLREKMSFQSHTVSHPDLTTLNPERLDFELIESKRVLESGLGTKVTSVAYPAGAFNRAVSKASEKAGYLAAWKKGGGPVYPVNATTPYELPRIRIHGHTDFEKFKRRVANG